MYVPTEEEERFGRALVDAAFKVHKSLGPGLLESVYETCLLHELRLSDRHLGFLINFYVPLIKDGIQRLVR